MATSVKNFYALLSSAIAVSISIIFLSPTFSVAEPNGTIGFSVDIIHRDSPESPFYDSSLTPFERLSNALRRSHSRVKYFKVASMAASTEVTSDGGAYVMKITVGTPPVNIHAIADTGSDLIWTQCAPCNDCYRQKAPLFNPKSSSTFKELSCSSTQCQALARSSCYSNNTCEYSISYGDRSYSRGVLAAETVTLGSTNGRPASIPGTIFGCGFENGGTFNADGSGIVGLGGGSVSLISQMKSSIAGKFSYCLVPMSSQNSKPSQMNFGDNAGVSGTGVVSTPITPKSPDTFYFLTLEGLTVGTQKLGFYNSSSGSNPLEVHAGNGNIIIDSGTTLTYLPSDLYRRLEWAVKTAIGSKPVRDPLEILNLCYRVSSSLSLPVITAHFAGADVKLNPLNAFIRTSKDVACLAFAPATNIAIFGNVAQMNFLVGYDLGKRTVSFKPTDCAGK